MKKDYNTLTEEELLSKSRKGDTIAFDEIISRNRQYIYSWIFSKEKDELKAEDLYQRTIIKSWKAIKKFKGDSSYSTWAAAIARNLVIDDYRKKQRNKEDSIEDVPRYKLPPSAIDGGLNAFEKINKEEKVSALFKVLNKLSPPHKKILQFYYLDELSYKEIAEAMNCSVGTVMSRLFYAKKNVRKLIKCKKYLEKVFYD